MAKTDRGSANPEIAGWENNEASAFDNEVLREFDIRHIDELKDEQLLLSEERIRMHVHAVEPPAAPYRFALYQLQDLRDKMVLDYCAGTGETTVIIARKGPRRVEAFDISPLAVQVAKRRMAVNNVASLVSFQTMSAYSMAYSDDSFDVVFGNAVLHHLDLRIAMKEVARVLKPGGLAVFREPFSGSRLLSSIRRLIPIEGSVSDNERQLTSADIDCIKQDFARSEVTFMGILSRLDRLVKHPFVVQFLGVLDASMLKRLPFLRTYARSFVIVLTKDQK